VQEYFFFFFLCFTLAAGGKDCTRTNQDNLSNKQPSFLSLTFYLVEGGEEDERVSTETALLLIIAKVQATRGKSIFEFHRKKYHVIHHLETGFDL
jgi:hypothetical protein